MRIAVCYYGGLGGNTFRDGIGGTIPISKTFQSFKEKIIQLNPEDQFDFFVHSWSISNKSDIIKTLNPVDSIIENQIDFSKQAASKSKIFFDLKDIRPNLSLFLRKLFWKKSYNKLSNDRTKDKFRIYSRWYSTKKVIELKKNYEMKNNFKYDVIFLTRFDIFWHKSIKFNELVDGYFYSSNWYINKYFGLIKKNYSSRYFQDYWFAFNSKMSDEFSTLYDFLHDYYPCSHRASYQHAKKLFGKNKFRYILHLVKDYELYRRVKKTEINMYG